MSPSPDCAFDIRCQPPALLSGRHSDMGDEHATAHIPGLSREGGQLYHTTNNEKPAAAELIDSCTSTATGITSSVLHRETSSSIKDKKCLAASPTVSLKLNSKLLTGDQLLSVKTSTTSLSTKNTPSSNVDAEQLSDSDNCSDVWVPRTPSAAEAVSGIWIVGGQASTADRSSTVRRLARARKLRAELESPDPVFRRRVARAYPCPMKWRRADALDFGGRSSETVYRQPSALERRRAWRADGRIRHIDSDISQRDHTSVLSQCASTEKSVAPFTAMRYSSRIADEKETPAVQLVIDAGPTAGASIDKTNDQQQRMEESRNIEQPLHVPLSATTVTLVSSLLERLTSFRHSRSSVHDERQKQHKLIENRARKALRTITLIAFTRHYDFLRKLISTAEFLRYYKMHFNDAFFPAIP